MFGACMERSFEEISDSSVTSKKRTVVVCMLLHFLCEIRHVLLHEYFYPIYLYIVIFLYRQVWAVV